MSPSTARAFLTALQHSIPALRQIVPVIQYSSLIQRKCILSLARCMRIPPLDAPPTDFIYAQLWTVLNTPIMIPSSPVATLHFLLEPCDHMFRSPIYAGLINMLVRNIPLNRPEEYEKEIEGGIRKELLAATGIYHPTTFNWGALFELYPIAPPTDAYHLDYFVPSSLQREISLCFLRSKRKLEDSIFYPMMGTKTVGYMASETFRRLAPEADLDADVDLHSPSTTDFEVLYSRTGIKLQGYTEMRHAMKYTDLKPRPYYARGPDHYFASSYIQQVFNVLVDLFPCTHRKMRFLTTQIRCLEHESFFIYDYTSFTSSLHEVNNFLHTLARFYSDTSITVFDSAVGLRQINLGNYLEQYVKVCNEWSPFDVGRANVEGRYVGELLAYHNCGMLGVPGNISSCTLLHGLHLSILTLSLILCRVIGDDALAKKIMEDEDELFRLLRNIGLIAAEKTIIFGPQTDMDVNEDENQTWNYEKRIIMRVAGRVVTKFELMFAPYAALLGQDSKYHTVILSPIRDRIKRAMHTLTSLWIALEPTFYVPNAEETSVIQAFAMRLLSYLSRELRDENLESTRELQSRISKFKRLLMSTPFGYAYFDSWFWSIVGTRVELPEVYSYCTFPTEDEDVPLPGYPYVVHSSRIWGVLRKLQWCTYVERKEKVLVEFKDYQRLKDFFDGRVVKAYDLILNIDVPDHVLHSIRYVFSKNDPDGDEDDIDSYPDVDSVATA